MDNMLSHAVDEYDEFGYLSYSTMEDILNSFDKKLIATLIDDKTFIKNVENYLKINQ